MSTDKLTLEELKEYINIYIDRIDISDQLIAALEAGRRLRNAMSEVSGAYAEEICEDYDFVFKDPDKPKNNDNEEK
jgi:hypothetical protein